MLNYHFAKKVRNILLVSVFKHINHLKLKCHELVDCSVLQAVYIAHRNTVPTSIQTHKEKAIIS